MSKKVLVRTGFKESREVEVEVGKEYLIQPLNSRRTKNLGRRCVILDLGSEDATAKVRYLDNNRVGKANLSDLIPV